jgi:GcrA cell cycle regulator
MYWTEERVELLKRLWSEGLSASHIAAKLAEGVTRNAVIGKVHRLNLSGRAPTPRSAIPRPRRPREPSHPSRSAMMLRTSGSAALKPLLRVEMRPRPLPIPEPEPLRLVNLPQGGRVTILHLSDKTCKWPIGDPGRDDFCFCGHQPREGSPYCEYHARIAYQPLQDRRPRKVS